MTDLAKDDVLDDDNISDDEIDNDAGIKNEDVDDTPQPSEAETRALGLGWKPRDEWEGDPEDWTSAKRFNQTKDIIESNKSLRAEQDRTRHEFNRRIENNNLLGKQLMDQKITELKSKRDGAVADADIDTYNEANEQLENLEKPPEVKKPPVSQENYAKAVYDHPVTQQFIAENPWIKGDGAKAVYGQKIFADYLTNNSTNGTIEEGLKLVKESVNQAFPSSNPNREGKNSMGDRGTGSKRAASQSKLSMSDLTREEKNIYDSMGSTWKNQDDFLIAVADSRKGE